MGYNRGYGRQLSAQTEPTNGYWGVASGSPYYNQNDRNEQIYNYLWDNYSYFDFDGDGIVSPTDTVIFLRLLINIATEAILLNLPMSSNATRTTGSAIRDWFEDHRDNTTIARGTYNGSNIGTKGVYDIDADGSVSTMVDGLLVSYVFGTYSYGEVVHTDNTLQPHDGGPAVWNGSTWDYSGIEVIDDNRKGIFNSMNLTSYAGSSNYPTEVSAGDIIYDSTIKELVIYDGFNWSVQAASESWNASGGTSWTATQTMPNGINAFMKYHRFTTPGYLNVPSPNNVEFALIGGGGGGGSGRFMGGGGAGGITAGSGPVTTGNNTITVGDGGAGWTSWSIPWQPVAVTDTYTGDPGGDSTAGGLTAYGGGCTTHYQSTLVPNKHGGSGCGSPDHYGPYSVGLGAGSGYPSPTQQGHPGGVGTNDARYDGMPGTGLTGEIYFTGGGGGGAGSVGQGCPPNGTGIMDGGIGIPHSEFHNLNGSSSAPIYPGIQWQIPSSQGTGLPSYLASANVPSWPSFYQPHGLPTSSTTRTDRWFGGGGGGGQGRHTGSGAGSPYIMPSNFSAGGGGMGARGNHGTDGINGTGGGGGAGGFYSTTNYSGGDGGDGAVYVRYAQSDAKTYGSGGTESTHSLWRVHTFTSPGTFNLESVLNGADGSLYVIVVGGGGGGGADGGGGGGGGGVIQHTLPAASILPSRSDGISITVGTGGGGGNSSLNNPSEGIADSGTDSVFGACGDNPAKTALGGGGGGSNYNSGSDVHPGRPGASGGGGGGGWTVNSPGGAGTPGQGSPGYSGMESGNPQYFYGGGGGGAGGDNSSGGQNLNGKEGLGIANLPASVGTPGPDNSLRYFGGGGGGMRWSNSWPLGQGGPGGGGDGGSRAPSIQGTAGTNGTGGGGGGSTYGTTGGPTNFSGGSGIVIVKYLI